MNKKLIVILVLLIACIGIYLVNFRVHPSGSDAVPGALKVMITPAEVNTLGARWKSNAVSSSQVSGLQLGSIAPGTYSVSFTDVDGYTTPKSQEVVIKPATVTLVSGVYVRK